MDGAPLGWRVRDGERVRLAEVLAALSLATNLGAAWPPETALRTCLVGVGMHSSS